MKKYTVLLMRPESIAGEWPDGTPILGEASIDGEPELFEVNGEAI